MDRIIKISAHDCDICQGMAEADIRVAETFCMPMEVKELSDLAAESSDLRDYIVNFHLEGDGSLVVPIYVIASDGKMQASGGVKDEEELTNLVTAWKTWKSTQN